MSKKKTKEEATGPAVPAVSVSAHPRAKASIRRIRAWSGLAAFGIVLFLSLSAGVPGQEAGVRALVAGLVGNLAGGFCALAVWRQLVVAELRVVQHARRARARERAEAMAARTEPAAS